MMYKSVHLVYKAVHTQKCALTYNCVHKEGIMETQERRECM